MEEVRKRYEDARRMLESLAAGRVSLGLPSAVPTSGNLVEVVTGRDKAFTGGL